MWDHSDDLGHRIIPVRLGSKIERFENSTNPRGAGLIGHARIGRKSLVYAGATGCDFPHLDVHETAIIAAIRAERWRKSRRRPAGQARGLVRILGSARMLRSPSRFPAGGLCHCPAFRMLSLKVGSSNGRAAAQSRAASKSSLPSSWPPSCQWIETRASASLKMPLSRVM